MLDFTHMKVEELRQLLTTSGFSVEEANNIKGKRALVEKCKEVIAQSDEEFSFDEEVTEFDEETYVDSNETEVIPDYNSLEWSGFVMKQFGESELTDNNPNINGLRRVAELLLGPIVESGPESIDAPKTNNINEARASCIYKIVFSPFIINGELRIFKAAADSCISNTNEAYAIYPTAMAETRAEVRALRKALKLNNVASEELLTDRTVKQVIESQKPASSDGSWDDNSNINQAQVMFIKKKCESLNIDLEKFINSGSKQYNNINEISSSTAAAMIQRLNQYQSAGDESVNVPVELLRS